ncbi:MAG: metallophosphoesterase [Clostridia bacterium]|nr:metallophosphoesterase [Clostridia bacterium]
MKSMRKAILALLLCAALTAGSVLCAAAQEDLTAQAMRFGADGRFRILHITDTHLHADNVKDSTRLIALACDAEQPDLVMLTGDLAPEDSFEETAVRVDELMQVFEQRQIPVAVTFGNHDSENGAYTREAVMALYNAYDCSISIDDGDALTGCGTYRIPLLASESDALKFNLWVFDSGDYDSEGHYANVAEDQVAWYQAASAAAEAEAGGKVYGLAFQHIIVPQIYDALEKVGRKGAFAYKRIYAEDEFYRFSADAVNYGMLHEMPCPGYYDHGQFDAMAARGDVLAMFTGHDHTNAFGVQYKGIDIVNSLSTRYNGDAFSTQYGYRVIELDENAPDRYETRVVRWYDFVNDQNVRALADEKADRSLFSEIRFLGFFEKAFTDLSVLFVETFTGRTVRYPD